MAAGAVPAADFAALVNALDTAWRSYLTAAHAAASCKEAEQQRHYCAALQQAAPALQGACCSEEAALGSGMVLPLLIRQWTSLSLAARTCAPAPDAASAASRGDAAGSDSSGAEHAEDGGAGGSSAPAGSGCPAASTSPAGSRVGHGASDSGSTSTCSDSSSSRQATCQAFAGFEWVAEAMLSSGVLQAAATAVRPLAAGKAAALPTELRAPLADSLQDLLAVAATWPPAQRLLLDCGVLPFVVKLATRAPAQAHAPGSSAFTILRFLCESDAPDVSERTCQAVTLLGAVPAGLKALSAAAGAQAPMQQKLRLLVEDVRHFTSLALQCSKRDITCLAKPGCIHAIILLISLAGSCKAHLDTFGCGPQEGGESTAELDASSGQVFTDLSELLCMGLVEGQDCRRQARDEAGLLSKVVKFLVVRLGMPDALRTRAIWALFMLEKEQKNAVALQIATEQVGEARLFEYLHFATLLEGTALQPALTVLLAQVEYSLAACQKVMKSSNLQVLLEVLLGDDFPLKTRATCARVINVCMAADKQNRSHINAAIVQQALLHANAAPKLTALLNQMLLHLATTDRTESEVIELADMGAVLEICKHGPELASGKQFITDMQAAGITTPIISMLSRCCSDCAPLPTGWLAAVEHAVVVLKLCSDNLSLSDVGVLVGLLRHPSMMASQYPAGLSVAGSAAADAVGLAMRGMARCGEVSSVAMAAFVADSGLLSYLIAQLDYTIALQGALVGGYSWLELKQRVGPLLTLIATVDVECDMCSALPCKQPQPSSGCHTSGSVQCLACLRRAATVVLSLQSWWGQKLLPNLPALRRQGRKVNTFEGGPHVVDGVSSNDVLGIFVGCLVDLATHKAAYRARLTEAGLLSAVLAECRARWASTDARLLSLQDAVEQAAAADASSPERGGAWSDAQDRMAALLLDEEAAGEQRQRAAAARAAKRRQKKNRGQQAEPQDGTAVDCSRDGAAGAAAAEPASAPLSADHSAPGSPAGPGALPTPMADSWCMDSDEEELFCCPITHELMADPVVAADGFTYERTAIQGWLAVHDSSPMTNQALPHKQLVPNLAIRGAIAALRRQQCVT